MKISHIDASSTITNETTALQKLGFDNQADLQRTFASILNRMRPSSTILSIVSEIVSYIQILSIGFIATTEGILDGSSYTNFISIFFCGSMDVSILFSDKTQGNMILVIIYLFLLIFWVISYLVFMTKFKTTKTFYPVLINILYYLGFHIFRLLSVVTATSVGYFMRFLYIDPNSVYSILTFVSIAMFFSYIAIAMFMVRVVQSSPDVDVKNRFCFWPQNYIEPLYRYLLNYILPLILEMLRDLGEAAKIISYLIVLLSGVGGLIMIWHTESNLFPTGKIVLTTEYNILIVAPFLSIIYMYARGDSLYYILAFLVIVIAIGFLLSFITSRQTKKRIDLLYSKFENLTDNIKTANECMTLIKVGIVFNAPCITNHTLLNWAISRYPNHQQLLFLVSFIFYVIHMPYREILDLVSVAVDISPFSVYDGLLFFQIFNRLPTHEHQLMRKLDAVKRLYDLPKTSLRFFWEAVITHQWDEVIPRCKNFQKDINTISQTFQNLIFENPSSDSVILEFIKFAQEVEGNYKAANAAQKELINKSSFQETPEAQLDGESMVAMSKLSTIKSTIFLSEFSDTEHAADKVQHGIQSAINARPFFFPKRFYIAVNIIGLVSFAIVVASFVISQENSNRLNNQVLIALKVHEMSLALARILSTSIEFTTHNSAENSVTGQPFDYYSERDYLNELSNEVDQLLSSSFSLHGSLPKDFLKLWVNKEVTGTLLSPLEGIDQNVSLVAALRIYQMRARTLAFSPADYIGTLYDPSPEILQISYLYDAVANVTNIIIQSVAEVSISDIENEKIHIFLPLIIGLSINLLISIIFCPLTILGIMHEFDFFVSLYSSIPARIVQKILEKENEHQTFPKERDDQIRQKAQLPANSYHVCPIITVFIAIFFITPIPVAFTIGSYSEHSDQCLFVLNGLQISSQMISSLGHMFLYSFRLLTAFPSTFTEDEEVKAFKNSSEQLIDTYNELFIGGTDFFHTGVVTKEEIFDRYANSYPTLLGSGKINHNITALHEDVYYMYGLSQRLLELNNFTELGGLSSSWWKLYYPAAKASLDFGVQSYSDIFYTTAVDQKSNNNLLNTLGLIIGIIFFIVELIVTFGFTRLYLQSSLKCLLKPIMVMDPEFISESPLLIKFLQGDYDNPIRKISHENRKKNSNNSAPLFDFILEGVLIVTADGTVISSNKKFHEMMSNTAEEIIGLNVSSVFRTSSIQPLIDTLNRIKRGGKFQQCAVLETTLYSDDERELQVKISLIPQLEANERGNRTTICAFIISDRSELIKAQQLLRKEKAKVENLLDSILPHNIAVSLLNGQTEISFEVECASILFSDIVSFTPMCSNMTAKQIMTTLNTLFTEFDTELAKFMSVTKLKTIGDAYVCASGIFENDGSIEESTFQIVAFGSKMQEIIPVINNKLGTSIHMRIGIYTGGPLICGVLGKEKPLFEIIGSAVSLAEDLEATSLPDKIHISESTRKSIQQFGFKITERGNNIKVHGLDDQKTYTVG